jgi:hypothetical protein
VAIHSLHWFSSGQSAPEKFTRKFCKTNEQKQLFPTVTLLFLFQYQAFTEELPAWHTPCNTGHAATVSQRENPMLRHAVWLSTLE